MTNLRDVDPKSLDNSNIAVYSQQYHVPVITPSYVNKRLRINLTNATKDDDGALAFCLDFSIEAMKILKYPMLKEDGDCVEFLIAKSREYRDKFVDFVLTRIKVWFANGFGKQVEQSPNNSYDTLTPLEKMDVEQFPKRYRFRVPSDIYRSNY